MANEENSEVPQKENGWDEHQKLVLFRLDEITKAVADMRREIVDIKVDNGVLKMKSTVWGAVGSGVVILIMIAIEWLKK